eukprot:TRINITY_DN699_c0_g1_i6.p1 TRINITY_DN699_c0_g1~~TRINITY_DN699_c0_g1_i6.p1  ORF type:complete len:546 (+),score=84.35 TRINITY_DN699_c0_g1_i6:301-1938(+)
MASLDEDTPSSLPRMEEDFSLWLSAEILVHIFSLLPTSVNIVRMVNRRWCRLSKDRVVFGRKLHLNVVVLGPSQVGKSTLLGHLLCLTGDIQEHEKKKTFKEAEVAGKTYKRFSWLMDNLKSERELIDATVDLHRFRMNTPEHFITFIDTPGKEKYMKNMISGITQSDHALLIVPSDPSEFESKWRSMRTQLEICKIAKIKRILVAINQIDRRQEGDPPPDYRLQIGMLTDHLAHLGYKDTKFVFVSGLEGKNLVPDRSRDVDSSTGESLYEAITSVFDEIHRDYHRPMRVCIDHAVHLNGIGTVVVGTVIQGIVFRGQKVQMGPTELQTTVRSLHLALPKTPIEFGFPGDVVAMNLPGISRKDCRSRKLGMVLGYWGEEEKTTVQQAVRSTAIPAAGGQVRTLARALEEKREEQMKLNRERLRLKIRYSPLFGCTSFVAVVYLFNPKGKVAIGYQPTLHVHNAQFPVKIDRIVELVSYKSEDSEREKDGRLVRIFPGDTVVVEFRPNRKISVDTVERCAKLGRFILRESYEIIGGGIIRETRFE